LKTYIRIIPPFLVRFFARPYVAGDSLAKAMSAALLDDAGLLDVAAPTLAVFTVNPDDEAGTVDSVAYVLGRGLLVVDDSGLSDGATTSLVSAAAQGHWGIPLR
jgi:hypothetical protein